MLRWRLALAAVMLLVVGLPLAAPVLELTRQRQGWHVWSEGERLSALALNTLRLVAGTLALALPAGVAGAVLLYRTDLPGRKLLRLLTVLALFVPLPLFASAWQATLGTGGWLPVAAWSTPREGDPDVTPTGLTWKPWAQGLPAAVWIHAAAALPWVVLLVGHGLRWVEPELEEDALTAAGPARVLWSVTLPRCRAVIAAAALWVALQTATEITITDMLQVRTFAEEVYYQYVLGDRAAQARSVAVNLPVVLAAWVLVLGTVRRLQASLPPLRTLAEEPLLFRLGPWRWPCLLAVLLGVALLTGVPLVSLVWKAGVGGQPEAWSAARAGQHLARVFRADGRLVAGDLAVAAVTGAVTATLALVSGWLAVEDRKFQAFALSLAALSWALPAPVLGLGLKDVINAILDGEDALTATLGLSHVHPLGRALYFGPSPLPVVWADLVRFFPYAVALLWPLLRQFPAELRDAARVDGARPRQELCRVIWPVLVPAWLAAALAVAVLSLGELGASKLVATPGATTFAHELFNQMHYGVTNDLAALCLVLLLMVVVGGGLAAVAGRLVDRSGGNMP